MPAGRVAELPSRAVLHVAGDEAAGFLDRIVTADIDAIGDNEAGYGALLTPQGKILTDFLILRTGNGFLLDVPAPALGDLMKRLTLYRLRAKVGFEDVSEHFAVLAIWDGATPPGGSSVVAPDPRHPRLGFRAVLPRASGEFARTATEEDFERHRAGLGVPAIGLDFAFGEAFPHDIGMDALSGVAFDKGCYIGQEVVSRMEHRSTARRRPCLVSTDRNLPPTGTEITADGKPAGTLGSAFGQDGLAILRLDRIGEAIATRTPILAGDVPVAISLPDWAAWSWPGHDGA